MDTRLITGFSVLFTVLALPWSLQEPHRLPLNVVGVSLSLVLLVKPVSLSAGTLACVTLTTGPCTAYLALTAREPALAAAVAVCVVLQVSCLRGRRQAWAQTVALMATWAVAAAVTSDDYARELLDLSPIFVMLLLLTAVMTQVRRHLDQLLVLLQHQADHDPLTGLLNRQGLGRRLRQTGLTTLADGSAGGATGAGPAGGGTPVAGGGAEVDEVPAVAAAALGVLVIDVDHFKTVNDRHGHLAGDEALMWLAGLLRGALPTPTVVARFGGEEFLVVLPGCDREQLLGTAERLRALVATTSTSRAVPLTVSVGAAVGTTGVGFEQLVALADDRLYVAKRSGRNCVQAHASLISAGEPGLMTV